MSTLTLADAIEISGGPVTANQCPRVIPLDQLAQLCATLESLGQHYEKIMERAQSRYFGAIALTMSPAFSCRVRPIQEGGYALLVPLGMPARIRVLVRLLLRYWNRERGVRFIRSALDEMHGDADAVPPLLKPIFLEDFEPEHFWEHLQRLDDFIDADPRFEPDVSELVHLALVYLLSHEFTHVLHGHFDLLERAKSKPLGLTDAELRRGVETDADDGAAAVSMIIVKDDVERAQAAGASARIDLAWLRLTYAAGVIFAIGDAHKKYFSAYDKGAYNHPMVRYELFLQSATRCLDASAAVKELWAANSNAGWVRCIQALEDLNLDATGGLFGKLPPGVRGAPLHALLYSGSPGGVTDRATLDKCRDALELMRRVRLLLPLFQKSPTQA